MEADMKRTEHSVARTARAGFTLIEIMLVVVIIGLLASIVTVAIPKYLEWARTNKAKADINAIELGIDSYNMINGKYPASLDLLMQGDDPYFKKGIPMDPWGNPYQYTYPGAHKPLKYDVKSLGQDGVDSEDDICNWKQDTGPGGIK